MTDVIVAYIGIGSNIGDREENCRKAVAFLSEAGTVAAVSSFYETGPVGRREQRDFINAVAAVETVLSPLELLRICRSVEERLGRTRDVHWGPRTMDLDILLYGGEVLDLPDLKVPHPRMEERLFALLPLAEIAPAVVHPVLGKTVRMLAEEVKGPQQVRKLPQEPDRP